MRVTTTSNVRKAMTPEVRAYLDAMKPGDDGVTVHLYASNWRGPYLARMFGPEGELRLTHSSLAGLLRLCAREVGLVL